MERPVLPSTKTPWFRYPEDLDPVLRDIRDNLDVLDSDVDGIQTGALPIALPGIAGALGEWDQGRQPETVEFHPDGSIIATPESGATITTTFLPDGSIQQVYGAPVNETWITTFGTDGSINREQVV